VNNGVDLVNFERLPPTVAISAMESDSIVGILTNLFGESGGKINVFRPGKHPDGFHVVEKRVSIPFIIEQYSTTRNCGAQKDGILKGAGWSIASFLHFCKLFLDPLHFAVGVVDILIREDHRADVI
jgi:hypothetical protein